MNRSGNGNKTFPEFPTRAGPAYQHSGVKFASQRSKSSRSQLDLAIDNSSQSQRRLFQQPQQEQDREQQQAAALEQLSAIKARMRALNKPASSLNSLAAHLSQSQAYTPASSSRARSRVGLASGSSAVEEEYVKNLQQQVYLLELETRYLREKKGHDFVEGGVSAQVEQNALPLRDTFRSLKLKYVEVQDKYQADMKQLEEQLDATKRDNHHRELELEHAQLEKEDLVREIQHLRDLRVDQTEMVHREFLTLRQQHQILQADKLQLQQSYTRVAADKSAVEEKLQATGSQLEGLRAAHASLTETHATLEQSLAQALQQQHSLEAEVELSSTATTSTALGVLRAQHEQLCADHVALGKRHAQLEAKHSASVAHCQALEQKLGEMAEQQGGWELTILEKSREVKKMTELLEKYRETEARRVQQRRGTDSSTSAEEDSKGENAIKVQLIAEQVANEMDTTRLASALVHLKARDQRIAELERQLSQRGVELEHLAEERQVLNERIDSLTATLRLQEEQLVVTEEERNALGASLKASEQKYDEVMARLKQVLIENETIHTDLDETRKEVHRLRQVEKIAVQMREWQNMMEENAKMAAEMQQLVQKFSTSAVKSEVAAGQQLKGQPPPLPPTKPNSVDVAMSSIMNM